MRVFFFLIVLLTIAVVLRIDFFFTVFYLFVLVYALAHIWMQITAKRLTIRRRFDDHAFIGDQVLVELDVHNQGWLPLPWLEAHESLPVQLATPPFHRHVFSLGPHARRRLSYRLHCQQRGYYVIGPLAVRSGDLLGLVRPRLERAESAHLIVYPRVLSLEQLGLPTRSPLVALPARSPLFEDPARVMGVREYQRGDSPRRIHWSASAKATAVAAWAASGPAAGTMHLMVKRYQPAIARDTLICLDLYQEDYGQRQRYTATELAIVVAASLANHIIVREGLPAGLLTAALDPYSELDQGPMPPHAPRSVWAVGHQAAEGAASSPAAVRPASFVPASSSASTPDATPRLRGASGPVRFFLPPRTGRGHLMSVLEILARVRSVPSDAAPRLREAPRLRGAAGSATQAASTSFVAPTSFVGLLRRAATSLSWGSTIAIVTGQETQELLDVLFHLRRAGYAVALILVQPGALTQALRDRSAPGVPIYSVWQDRDLESMVGEAVGQTTVRGRRQ